MISNLISYLFETRAIRVCPRNKPFWYTSGRIGPYYINTHFLFGSEGQANQLLARIDEIKDDKDGCSGVIHGLVLEQYESNGIYRGTMDGMIAYIRDNLDPGSFEYISGGERRDWFFSFLAADRLGKPHITLFKDMDARIYEGGASRAAGNLGGAKVLHIADLITTASSYERAWAPAVSGLGGVMGKSLVVVDRLQGGREVLKGLGIESHALARIVPEVFEKAHERGYIDEDQLRMVLDYIEDPEGSMRSFLIAHPTFITEALESGGKAAERAKLLVENNFYNLKAR